MLESRQVELERVLELEEDRAQLLAQTAGGIDDQVDGLLLDGEALDVADVAAALDGEQKARRGLLSPGGEALRCRLTIERIVQFNGIEVPGIEGKVLACRQLLRIEALAPVRVRPTRAANPNVASH